MDLPVRAMNPWKNDADFSKVNLKKENWIEDAVDEDTAEEEVTEDNE